MHRARLAAALVLENVARAYSPEEVERGLMESPGHRANILSREATDVGVGVALGHEIGGARELFVTQLFVRRNPTADPAMATEQLYALVAERRRARHRPGLARDQALEQAATEFARAVAAGKVTRSDGERASRRAGELAAGRFGEIATLVVELPEVARFPEAPALEEASTSAIGVGVAVVDSTSMGRGALLVTVVVGKRR
jgi:hypothetical protein